MNILLLNAGSSSLKATLMKGADGAVLARGAADWAGKTAHYVFEATGKSERSQTVPWRGHAQAVGRFVADLTDSPSAILANRSALAAVGHRVVHGGSFTSSVCVTPDLRSRILELADIAPLHNPPSLEALTAAELEFPTIPQVAVFDTTFHATLPAEAYTYPVPGSWTRDWRIRRFGFHGLSYAYCSRRAAELLDRPLGELRLIICHLGHGCSAAAIDRGISIDTTMGFTPLDGLMMATRSGSLDPGIIFHVQQHHHLTTEQVEDSLHRESGLLGVSGVSGDMRDVLAAAHQGHPSAQLALMMYTRRVRQAIGSLAVTLGRVDALVFTAGVGENASEVRRQVCSNLDCLGLVLNPDANGDCVPDMDIATPGSRGRILVITTREDLTMLREVIGVLEARTRP